MEAEESYRTANSKLSSLKSRMNTTDEQQVKNEEKAEEVIDDMTNTLKRAEKAVKRGLDSMVNAMIESGDSIPQILAHPQYRASIKIFVRALYETGYTGVEIKELLKAHKEQVEAYF